MSAAALALPPVTVAKIRVALDLLDALADEHRDRMLQRMQEHRDAHHDHAARPLGAGEAMEAAVRIASSAGVTDPDGLVGLAENVQSSGLRMTVEPDGSQLLLSAVASLGGAAADVALRFVALIEMPNDTMEQHAEEGTLTTALEEYSRTVLGPLGGREARARIEAAYVAFSEEWGLGQGEAPARLLRPLWDALMQAGRTMSDSISGSFTPSLAPTAGTDAPSSTTPGTGTP